jgi:hypothetical protein
MSVCHNREDTNPKNKVKYLMRQGQACPETKLRRILQLLSMTEMGVPEIALRMGCSRSLVLSINRRYSVRSYDGRRKKWYLPGRTA